MSTQRPKADAAVGASSGTDPTKMVSSTRTADVSPLEQAALAQLRAVALLFVAGGDLLVRVGKRATCKNALGALGLVAGLIIARLIGDGWLAHVQRVLLALAACWLMMLVGGYLDERRAARRAARLAADESALLTLKLASQPGARDK